MRRIFIGIGGLFIGLSAWAEVHTIMEIPPETWIQDSIEILSETRTERGIEIPPGVVFIENATPERVEIPLLVLDHPSISSNSYSIMGEVFHVDVEDEGYLETWNHFDQGGPYFTRTMSEFGPMRWLANTSMGFREFSLPFQTGGGSDSRTTKVELNLVLPSTGRVYLRNLRLVEYTGFSDPHSTPGEWWSPRVSGTVGGLLGVLGGLLGTLLGLCGPLVSKGKAKGITMGLVLLLTVAGFFQSLVGMIAFFGGQPHHVYYPLLLAGLLELCLGILFLVLVSRRYAQVTPEK